MSLNPGDLFAGRYRVERALGRSAIVEAYAAKEEGSGRGVVLERLLLPPGADPQMGERIVHEARAASGRGLTGIVAVLDAGVTDGEPWLAKERLEGETLEHRLGWGRSVSEADALRIGDGLLAALEEAQAAGLVHRDLQPANVFLERLAQGGERVKIDGFGTAPLPLGEITGQTQTGIALGTPHYLAPEHASGAGAVDARADVYGVGAILFHMLTGRRPYDAASFGDLVQRMHSSGPRPVREVAPTVSPALAALVDRCLAIDPAARPGSASELRAALKDASSSAPAGAAAPASGSAPGVAATMALHASGPPQPQGFAAPPPGGAGPASPAPTAQPAPGHPPAGALAATPAPPVAAAPAQPPRSGGGGAIIALLLVGGAVLMGGMLVVFAAAGAIFYVVGARSAQEVQPPAPAPSPIVSVSSLALPGASEERVRIAAEGAPALGGEEPLVTIVTFSDFECPFCARVDPTMAQIRQSYGDQVRYVWRDNPLPFHTNAMPAAEAAREAYAQGGDERFWAMHGLLFENQRQLDRASLELYGTRAGLDLDGLRTALDTHRHRAAIERDQQMARTANATGTPAFFINGRSLRGAQPYERFRVVVDEEIALANELMRRGVQRRDLYETFQREAVTAPTPEPPRPVADRPPRPRDGERYAIAIPEDAPSWGSASAPVTIQIFSDFQCPFCGRVQPTLEQIRDTYEGRVRLVWRNYPLPFHQRAMPAAQAAMEVHAQGGDEAFWRYHDLLFENQRALEDADLERYASQVSGVRSGRVGAALRDGRHRARVQSDMDAIEAAGARIGTPSFFINGRLLQGAQPFEAFRSAIDEELERAER